MSEKSQLKPILPLLPIFLPFCPTCASVGPQPSHYTIPAPRPPVHPSCHSPDPIPALNCPRPHTLQAPSHSTSKGRLHKGVGASFPRVTFLRGKVVLSPASTFPQPSLGEKPTQCKCCCRGVSCPGKGSPCSQSTQFQLRVHLQGHTQSTSTTRANPSQQGVVGKRGQTKFLTGHGTHRTPNSCISEKRRVQ